MKNWKVVKKMGLTIILLINSLIIWGQIFSENFDAGSSPYGFSSISGGLAYTGSSGTGDRPPSSTFFNSSTTAYGLNGNSSAVLTSNSINTNNYTNIQLTFRLSAWSMNSTGNGMDGGDNVTVEVSPNGGTNWYNTIVVSGNSNAYWHYSTGTGTATTAYDGNTTPVSFAPSGGGNRTSDGYSTVVITSLPSSSNMRFRVTLFANDVNERWTIDDFSLTGTVSCTPPSTQATNFSATNIQNNQMQVNWARGNGDNVIVVARQGSPVSTDPSNGTSYTANASFGTSGTGLGAGYVVYNGPGTNVTVTNLNQNTTYHFAIYEYNNTGVCYNLTELTGNATTLFPDIQLEQPIGTNKDCGFSLSFGSVVVGANASQTVRIRNLGTADLNLTSLPLSIGGTNPGDFSISTQPTSPIAVGAYSDMVIQFAPTAGGIRNATISIANNDSDENPCTILLSGTGVVPPSITHTGTSPASANIQQGSTNNVLYSVKVDVTTTTATLTQVVATTGGTWASGNLTNLKLWFSTDANFGGDATIATISSPAPGDITFTVSNQSFPIGSRWLFITCDVAAGATIGNTVSAFTDANSDFTYSVSPVYSGSSFANANLMTIVGVPEIQLEQPIGTNKACGFTLSFGSVVIGANTSQTVRIRNLGTSDLNLTSLPLSIGGTNPGDFSITTQPTSPIAAGAYSDMVIQFAPTAGGIRNATVSIANNDGDENPCTINLTGTGTLANDDCSGAIALTVNSGNSCANSISGNTVGATNSNVTGCIVGTPDDDIWYSFVATSTNHNITVTGNTDMDIVLNLRSGTCGSTTSLYCQDVTFDGETETIYATNLIIGNTYFIRLYDYYSGSGGFTNLCVTTPQPSYYQSNATGNWNAPSTWQTSIDGNSWTAASFVPNSTDLTVTIRNSHIVTVSSSMTVDQVVIENGGTLVHSGGTMTVNDGIGSDLEIQNGGKLSLSTSNIYPSVSSPATISVLTGGMITVSNSGIIHNIQTNGYDYQNGSILEYTSTNAPATNGITFFPNASSLVVPILRFTSAIGSGVGGGSPTVVNGILEVSSGGSITWSGTGTKTFRNGIQGGGTLSQGTAGLIQITESATSISTSNLTLGANGMTITSSSVVTLGSNQSLGSGKITVQGIIDFGNHTISGGGDFTLATGGTLKTTNQTGLFGSILVSGVKTFQDGTNYEFNATGNQTIATLLPPTVNNLTLSGSGVKYLSQPGNRTINGVLTISGATLKLDAGVTYQLKGNIINNGGSTLITGTTFNFSGTGAQSIGGTTSTTFGDLTISNIAQPVTSNIHFSVLGSLRIGANAKMNLFGGGDSPVDGSLYLNNVQQYAGTHGSSASSPPAMYQNNDYFSTIGTKRVTVAMGAPLPVELLTFTAKKEQLATALSWQTASETNNEKFKVERSEDGLTFSTIGEVLGNGTSHELNSYNFLDRNPANGINYYRLKQMDFDGQFEYSKIIYIDFSGGKGNILVFPTYVDQQVQVQFSSATNESGTVFVFDTNGRLTKMVNFEPGTTNLTVTTMELQPGIHILKVQNGPILESFKLIKL